MSEEITQEKIDELASRYFHGQEGYNCAQATIAIAHELIGSSDEEISTASSWGGGRAEDGYCGALYGALRLCPENKRQEVIEQFKREVGAIRCKEIRPANLTPCQKCVAIASKIVCSTIK